MLGLKNNLNVLSDYDPAWACAYAQERVRLDSALGISAKAIEHFGSTSIPGMRAKPILDILVGVHPAEDWERCRTPLETIGYAYVPSAGIPRHSIFVRGRDQTERTHIVHIVDYHSDEWTLNVAFRDALRSDPALRERYLAEKDRAAAAAPQGRARYTELKTSFISSIKGGLMSGMPPRTSV